MQPVRGLNVLRGLAALLIVIHHARPNVLPDMPEAHGALGFLLWNLRDWGWSGIDLFFVLGGFFMADAILSDLDRVGRVRLGRYWKRRAVRILPSYYVLLAVLALSGATGWLDLSTPLGAVRDLLVHGLFLHHYLDQEPNGPTWFLGAMVQFYLILPLGCQLLAGRYGVAFKRYFPVIALALIGFTILLRVLWVASGNHVPNDFMLTHFRGDAVLIGMLAMYAFRQQYPLMCWLRRQPWCSVLVALCMIAPAMAFPRKDPFMFILGFTLLACGYAGLILLIVSGAIRVAGKGWAVPAAVASCSYNVYLWHYFLPRLTSRTYSALQHSIEAVIGFVPLVILVQVGVFVLLSMGVGYGLTLLIERPARRVLMAM